MSLIKLKVLLDGTEPGLAQHRLSINSFADPLKQLLRALQVTASRMLSDASNDPAYGELGGKRKKPAMQLDLELFEIVGGCAELVFDVVYHPSPGEIDKQLELLDSLPERATLRLIDDIEHEQRGELRNGPARTYLKSLPVGIERQKYTVQSDDQTVKVVEFGRLAIVEEETREMPTLEKITGKVAVVGFEEGKEFITIKPDVGPSIKTSATQEQVENSLSLRVGLVDVAFVDWANRARLVWIRKHQPEKEVLSREQLNDYIFSTWDLTLKRLSE